MKKWPSRNNLPTKLFVFALEKRYKYQIKLYFRDKEEKEDETSFLHRNITCKKIPWAKSKDFFLPLYAKDHATYFLHL